MKDDAPQTCCLPLFMLMQFGHMVSMYSGTSGVALKGERNEV